MTVGSKNWALDSPYFWLFKNDLGEQYSTNGKYIFASLSLYNKGESLNVFETKLSAVNSDSSL